MTVALMPTPLPFRAKCTACGRVWIQTEEWAPDSALACVCGALAVTAPSSDLDFLAHIASVLDRIDGRLAGLTVEEIPAEVGGEAPPALDPARDPAGPHPGFQRWRSRQGGHT